MVHERLSHNRNARNTLNTHRRTHGGERDRAMATTLVAVGTMIALRTEA